MGRIQPSLPALTVAEESKVSVAAPVPNAGQPTSPPVTASVLPPEPPPVVKPFRGNQYSNPKPVVPATVAEVQKRSVAFAAHQIIPTEPLPDSMPEWPKDCPRDHEGWKDSVSYLLGIAIFRMAKRLALEGANMPLRDMTLSMAVATDKRLLLTGQPTSFNFSMSTTMSHDDMIKRIRGETTRSPIEQGGNVSVEPPELATPLPCSGSSPP